MQDKLSRLLHKAQDVVPPLPSPSSISRMWRLPLKALGVNLNEARELAALLQETVPDLHIDAGLGSGLVHRSSTPSQLRAPPYKDRLKNGVPIPINDVNWGQLRAVVSTESLKEGEPGNLQVEVNSGGRVFFCFFAPRRAGDAEGVAVLKFGPNRLLMQAEQFANELTRHLDISAPDCRIVRQAGASSEEWKALVDVCTRLVGQPVSHEPLQHPHPHFTDAHSAHEGAGGIPAGGVGAAAGGSGQSSRPAAQPPPAHQGAHGQQHPPAGGHAAAATSSPRHGTHPGGAAGSPAAGAHGAGGHAAHSPPAGGGPHPSPGGPAGAAGGLHSGVAELLVELTSLPVVLLMEFCPGAALLECEEAFKSPGPLLSTFEGLGRLFSLDLVLGNADRLPCRDLGWRGNPNNLLFGRMGSRCSHQLVAIDSCVQRRPPAARLSAEDEGVDRLSQLLLTDQDVTLDLLRGILTHSVPGQAALQKHTTQCAEAFQRGFRSCLGHVERIKGLLEMMHSKMHDWSMEFIGDIRDLRPELPIPTPAVTAGPTPGSVIQARYTGLNIRVSPGAGYGAGNGYGYGARLSSRNRTPARTMGGHTGSGPSSLTASPARSRASPYHNRSTLGRSNHLGASPGAVSGSLPTDPSILASPSSTARRRGSLGGAAAAAADAAILKDSVSSPSSTLNSGAVRGGAGHGSEAGTPGSHRQPSHGDAWSGDTGTPQPSGIRAAANRTGRNAHSAGGAPPASAASPAAGGVRASAASPPRHHVHEGWGESEVASPAQRIPLNAPAGKADPNALPPACRSGSSRRRRNSASQRPGGMDAAAVAAMPSWALRSPYMAAEHIAHAAHASPGGSSVASAGGGGACAQSGGLSVMASRRRPSSSSGSSLLPALPGAAPASAAGPARPSASGSISGSEASSASFDRYSGRPTAASSGTGSRAPGVAHGQPATPSVGTPQSAAVCPGATDSLEISPPYEGEPPRSSAAAGGGLALTTPTRHTVHSAVPFASAPVHPSPRDSDASASSSSPRLPRVKAERTGRQPSPGSRGAKNAGAASSPIPHASAASPRGRVSPSRSGTVAAARHQLQGERGAHGAGRSAGNSPSPSRLPPALRVRDPAAQSVLNRGAAAGGSSGGASHASGGSGTLGLRTSRSFGVLRSPARRGRPGNASPRKGLMGISPASPKFRSPIVEPLPPLAGAAPPPESSGAGAGPGAAGAGGGVDAALLLLSATSLEHQGSLLSHMGSLGGAGPQDGSLSVSFEFSALAAAELASGGSMQRTHSTPHGELDGAGGVGGAGAGLGLSAGAGGPRTPRVRRLSHLHPTAAGAVNEGGPDGAQQLAPRHAAEHAPAPASSLGPAAQGGRALSSAASVPAALGPVAGSTGIEYSGAPAAGLPSKPPLPRSGSSKTSTSGAFPAASAASSSGSHAAQGAQQLPKLAAGPLGPLLTSEGSASGPAVDPAPSPFSFSQVCSVAESPRSFTMASPGVSGATGATPTPSRLGGRASAGAHAGHAGDPAAAAPGGSPHTPQGQLMHGPHTPSPGSSAQPASSAARSGSTAKSAHSGGSAVSRAPGGGGRAGGRGSNRKGATPGSGPGGPFLVRAIPNHTSPYEQLKSDMSLTMALKSISNEARKDDLLSSRVQHWKEVFRTRGEELKAAVGEWQSRYALERVLTTGFLDGTHPIVDTYELKVRLEHMLRRLQVLQEAAAAQKPSAVMPPPEGLFLGGAVSADSHHILRHLGVTHIVNATEELLLPPPSTGFVVLRVALRDVDDEDIAAHFEAVCDFVQACHASGGSVLIHCSEGKSRSVTLVLAYLMRVKGWKLKDAYEHVKSRRAVACPNAGFTAKLLAFERQLYGVNTWQPAHLKKAKPEPITCPVCGAAVGISSASLAVHMKRVHPPPAQEGASVGSSCGGSEGAAAGGDRERPAAEAALRGGSSHRLGRPGSHSKAQGQQQGGQQGAAQGSAEGAGV